jgi:hypothetical protein
LKEISTLERSAETYQRKLTHELQCMETGNELDSSGKTKVIQIKPTIGINAKVQLTSFRREKSNKRQYQTEVQKQQCLPAHLF